jgi:hypothetical protein
MGSVNDRRNRKQVGASQYYRAQAEYCRQQAEHAETELRIRQEYLELAAKWEGLARQAETS